MRNFLNAYANGWPAVVERPDGRFALVVGFVQFADGVAYMDDGFLIPMNSTFSEHHMYGDVVENPDSTLSCSGHRFFAADHGEEAIYWYLQHFPNKGTTPQTERVKSVQRRAEHVLRVQRFEAWLDAEQQLAAQHSKRDADRSSVNKTRPQTLRDCLAEPSSECFAVASLLSAAADAHLKKQHAEASELLAFANREQVRAHTEFMWGAGCADRHKFNFIPDAPPRLPLQDRPKPRMPTFETQQAVLLRDGYHCRFCGMPVIPTAIRQLMAKAYPVAVPWGRTNITQHAAFQCLWLQFDHILPNSRGGTSAIDNIVVTCAPCNFGRMETTLAEARLVDPLSRPTPRKWPGFDQWDGLTRLLSP